MIDIHYDKILILDFGSQYTQLIARRLREIGIYCELVTSTVEREFVDTFAPKGIILSGGPESVHIESSETIPAFLFELGIPILGICYGMQAMAAQLGGSVARAQHCEFGHAILDITCENPLFKGLGTKLDVWMSHGDKVNTLPDNFHVIGKTNNASIAAMADFEKQFYGLQFHPEVTHTQDGHLIFEHFVKDICNCQTNWTASNIIDDRIETIKKQVGDDEVLVALSGGVDSAVTAALIHKAIGDKLTCIFVDTGLLRLAEGDAVMQAIHDHLGLRVLRVDAYDDFFKRLKGVEDPEVKRKLIGETFIRIFEREAEQLKGIKWLGQGTIYPDVIESAASVSGKAHMIKSHHNVGGLPLQMRLKLIEPLRELFKDEVRRVGLELGLPKQLLFRHPFPGPGLGVRILGEIKPEYVTILRKADAIFIDQLRRHNLYDEVAQAFAVFLPVKSVGVKGDGRVHEYVIALRAVKTVDFMTAHAAHLPHVFLMDVANRIMNEVEGVARVVYDISGKPPSTIEWE